MEKKCGDVNTLLLELPFLKLLCPKEFSMCAGERTSVCRNGVSPVGVGHSHHASLGQPQLPHQPPRGDRNTGQPAVFLALKEAPVIESFLIFYTIRPFLLMKVSSSSCP